MDIHDKTNKSRIIVYLHLLLLIRSPRLTVMSYPATARTKPGIMPGWHELVLALLAYGQRLARTPPLFLSCPQQCLPFIVALVRTCARHVPDKDLLAHPTLCPSGQPHP
jgi:hypothetical protein